METPKTDAPISREIDGKIYVLAEAAEFDRETAFARGWVKALEGQQYATHGAQAWERFKRYQDALETIAEARLWGLEPESDALILFAKETLGEDVEALVVQAGSMAEAQLVNLRAALEELSG